MTTEPQNNCQEISAGDAAKRDSTQFHRSASGAFRFILLTAAVAAVILAFAADIDGIVKGRAYQFSYPLGCSLVNYSAGFVRRGLLQNHVRFSTLGFAPARTFRVMHQFIAVL